MKDGLTYATGKPYPPMDQWVPRVFFREGAFYVIDLPTDEDLASHARCNPGTLRVEDIEGNVLWSAQ